MFAAVEILVFITIQVPKQIKLSELITIKCCEDNTEYSIFTYSKTLSLTQGDNNYSALRRRTSIKDPILGK